jgi:hypothetical protein
LGARVLASLMRLPQSSQSADTRLIVTRTGNSERWHRAFEGCDLVSYQYPTGDAEFGERIGILEFRFRVDARSGSLRFRQVGFALVTASRRVEVPARWAASVEAREDAAGARAVAISVRVTVPVFGPLISYDGIIHVEDDPV